MIVGNVASKGRLVIWLQNLNFNARWARRDTMAEVLMTIFIAGFLVAMSYNSGKTDGRIEVASGEFSCVLEVKKDKTNYWKCVAKE